MGGGGMPVQQERLIPLLVLCISGYFGGSWIIKSLAEGIQGSLDMEREDGGVNSQSLLFKETKENERVFKYTSDLTHREFWKHLQDGGEVLDEFTQILQRNPFKAYFFETPHINIQLLDSKFEFVIVDAPSLEDVYEDRGAFQDYMTNDSPAVSFHNLGGDAVLVAPTPLSSSPMYSHLALFVRKAPPQQVEDFWRLAGKVATETVKERGKQPVWISTSGLGVYYLHLRYDSRPKYYTYAPYKK